MSTLLIVLLSVLYGTVGILTACRVGTLLAWRFLRIHNAKYNYGSYSREETEPDGEQWFGSMLLGLLVGAFWPIAAAGWTVRGVLFAPPADVVKKQQADRIAELEKELSIHG